GLWHAGRGHRGDPDRPWFLAARSLRPVADRQYRTGRLRRARHPDRGPFQRYRDRPVPPWRDGRTSVAIFLLDRAVLADLGLCRLPRHVGGMAGSPRDWRIVRDPAIPDFELHQSMDRRHRRFAGLDGVPRIVPEGLATEGTVALAGAAQPR